jgi:uncharacterized protein
MIWYTILPIVGWFTSGVLKFLINAIRFGGFEQAKQQAGNGGFPSTHTTVVTSTLSYIGFMEGFNTPIFSIGLAFLLITVIDATGVRRAIGKHAQRLNGLSPKAKDQKALREKQGHTWSEVFGGMVLGTLIGYAVYLNT